MTTTAYWEWLLLHWLTTRCWKSVCTVQRQRGDIPGDWHPLGRETEECNSGMPSDSQHWQASASTGYKGLRMFPCIGHLWGHPSTSLHLWLMTAECTMVLTLSTGRTFCMIQRWIDRNSLMLSQKWMCWWFNPSTVQEHPLIAMTDTCDETGAVCADPKNVLSWGSLWWTLNTTQIITSRIACFLTKSKSEGTRILSARESSSVDHAESC